jgi:hypothetical protein
MAEDLLSMLKLKYMNRTADATESELSRRIRAAERSLPPAVLDRVTKQITEALPKAEKQYGLNHPSYLFYIELLMVCIWCNRYIGIAEDSQLRISNLKIENMVVREQLLQAEKELSRFETAEDFLLNGSLDWYMRTVIDRIGHALPDHPRIQAFSQALDVLASGGFGSAQQQVTAPPADSINK